MVTCCFLFEWTSMKALVDYIAIEDMEDLVWEDLMRR
jgi:hypothetical protein